MLDIMRVLMCLNQSLENTNLRRLCRIVEALLSATGRVTMQGLSRWSEQGGSYRTIQRFFSTSIDWAQLHWLLIREHLLGEETEWLLGGDEVVVTKSGKHTSGLGRFFSALYGKPVPGLCFLSLSLISVKRRCSYPLRLEPIVETATEGNSQAKPTGKAKRARKANKKASRSNPPEPKGRPKGSTNRNRREVELSPYLVFVQGIIRQVLTLLGQRLKVRYFVFDGAFGHNHALQMVRQSGLELISKLRHNAALYQPFEGEYRGRGPRKKYGAKLDYRQLPIEHLKENSVDGSIRTLIYQLPLWHKLFPDQLNVVIIVKIHQHTQVQKHIVLFSSDLALGYQQLIDYYRLRFQLEFNFRDAKQHWGLEDFMSIKPTPVYNSANLSMFMVTLSQVLMRPLREGCSGFSVNDLKALFRGRKYVLETIKCLPQMPEPIIIDQIIFQVAQLGRVNQELESA